MSETAGALNIFNRTDKQNKDSIVKVRNPDRRRWGKAKFIYFESQRDAIDWFLLNFSIEEEIFQSPYTTAKSKFSAE